MNYKTCTEMAKKWKVSSRTVRTFCSSGKIPGAKQLGNQWMIPEFTKKPIDGRTKKAKNDVNIYTSYHFPIFIHSYMYSRKDELTDEEKMLYDGETMYLEGRNAEAILLSKQLLTTSTPTHVKVGAYHTITYSSMLLGLKDECKKSIEAIDKIIEQKDLHQEDYKLLVTNLKFHITGIDDSLLHIDSSKLSDEAQIYYRISLLELSCFTKNKDHEFSMKYYVSDLQYLENNKLEPCVLAYSLYLAFKYSLLNDLETRKKLISKAIDIAVKNNWIPHLGKYYNHFPGEIDQIMKAKGTKYYEILKGTIKNSFRNWAIVHEKKVHVDMFKMYTSKQVSILTLLLNGLTIEEIAKIEDMSVYKMKQEIKQLCDIAHVSSKTKLEEYAEKLFNLSNS